MVVQRLYNNTKKNEDKLKNIDFYNDMIYNILNSKNSSYTTKVKGDSRMDYVDTKIDVEKLIKTTGERIKKLRKEKNETQEALAKVLSSTQNNVSKIEQGNISLTFENMLLIAEHYQVSLDYLCTDKKGIDTLDTLNKYIKFDVSSKSAITENKDDDKSHKIPELKINEKYYKYLKEKARIPSNSSMPKEIKELWEKQIEDAFKSELIQDDKKTVTIIAVTEEIFNENYKHNEYLVNRLESSLSS